VFFGLQVHKRSKFYLVSSNRTSSVTGINIYFHLVVQSYYKQQKGVTPGESKRVSAWSVTKIYPSQPATPLTQYLIQVPNLPPILFPPKKKLPKMSDAPGTEHFGSMVSWTEGEFM
jgi:hypothetical protein